MDSPPELVVISYPQLLEPPGGETLAQLERAFGPQGLGVIAVSDVPGYAEARERLLPLAEKLEQLPDASKKRLEDPESSYSFGWSYGKEALDDGRKDTLKGSFYANPLHDVPTTDAHLQHRYPSYCRPNMWPSEDLPSLEAGALLAPCVLLQSPSLESASAAPPDPHCPRDDVVVNVSPAPWRALSLEALDDSLAVHGTLSSHSIAFKSMGRMTVDVGLLLVSHCDRLVARRVAEAGGTFREGNLRAAIEASRTHKARLLIYMPRADSGSGCGIGNGSAAMPSAAEKETDAGGAAEAAHPGDAPAGSSHDPSRHSPADATERLWCAWHSDHGALTAAPCTFLSGIGVDGKVRIPEGCLAFQMGQAMSILSGGVLCATPHCVKAPQAELSRGVSRATFAVFMQPTWDELLLPPPGTCPSEAARKTWGPWKEGMTFGEFSEAIIAKHYT